MSRPRPSVQQRSRSQRVIFISIMLLAVCGLTVGITVAFTQPATFTRIMPKIQRVECTMLTDSAETEPCLPPLAAALSPLVGRGWLGSDIPTQANTVLTDLGWRVSRYSYQLPGTLKLVLVQDPWSYQILSGDQVWNVSATGQPMRSFTAASDSAQLRVSLRSSASAWQPPQPIPTDLHESLLRYLDFARQFPSQVPASLSWEEPQRLSGVLPQAPTTIMIDPAEMAIDLERLRLILQGWDPLTATASHQLDLRFKLPVLRITP